MRRSRYAKAFIAILKANHYYALSRVASTLPFLNLELQFGAQSGAQGE